ncbi:hypothetical protein FSARC_11035 [Fusarium sarcochroum]|uniref:O-methyltransferase n=1 Tax=Fusarium sarcochroum TaxID=1208366 RepID=A0A8H4TI97_9HYPO|nr:hypothetical protein FSARC_11035 [Fusarium sarcochroum]
MTSNGTTTSTNGSTPKVDVSMATSPNKIKAVPGLVKQIIAGADTLSESGDQAGHDLLIKARTVVQSLETSRETRAKHCWAQTGAIAGLSFGVETGLWKLMASNGDRPQKVSELAKSLDVDASLLGRLMRHLGAMGYINETDADVYLPTNYAKAMSIPIISDGYLAMLTCSSAAPIKFHKYLRKRGFNNPTDSLDQSMLPCRCPFWQSQSRRARIH